MHARVNIVGNFRRLDAERFGDRAAAALDFVGDRVQAADHALLEDSDTTIEGLGNFTGAFAQRQVDLVGLGGQRLCEGRRTVEQDSVNFRRFLVQRAGDLASAFTQHLGNFQRTLRQRFERQQTLGHLAADTVAVADDAVFELCKALGQ